MDIVIAWIVALIVSAAPPGRTQYFPDAKETEAETLTRYNEIARDVVEVVYDRNERPLFSGPYGRANTVTVVLAVMTYESHFRKDVDFGRGKFSKGDGGRSWGLMQVNLGARRIELVTASPGFAFTSDPNRGWSGEDLVRDRKKGVRAGLAILRSSFACGKPDLEKLNAYASGKCDSGQAESKTRMGLALLWQTTRRPSFTDNDVLRWLTQPVRSPE